MARLFFVVILFTLLIMLGNAQIGRNVSMPENIIRIAPASNSFPIPGIIQTNLFYTVYQTMYRYELNTVSTSFVKIPGLSFVFSHTVPLLYKIRFQGGCANLMADKASFLRIMIDNKILVSNKLLPNTDRRLDFAPYLGTSLREIDARGGVFLFTPLASATSWEQFSCAKTENVYLPAGMHSIDVVVRTDGVFYGYTGELTVELVEYSSNSGINLSMLNTQANES